jgi:hypothetical protein
MSALLTRFAVAGIHGHAMAPDEPLDQGGPSNPDGDTVSKTILSGETLNTQQTDPSPAAEVDKGPVHVGFEPTAASSSDHLGRQMMQDLDKKAFYSKLIVAWSLFFVFWTVSHPFLSLNNLLITHHQVGSAIFMATEGWSYGVSMYFCRPSTILDRLTYQFVLIVLQSGFVAFTTIGYGDYSPQTPAGRSVFVVWAILGVGTMTILISGA